MDYIVVANKSSWELELLIESFNVLNLQDKLLVVMPNTLKQFYKNLSKHKRKIYVKDKDQLNKIIGIYAAYDQLEQNFTMLHTDMIIVQDLKESLYNIIFHPNPIITDVIQTLKLKEESYISFDGVVSFKDIPKQFFYEVIQYTHVFLKKYDQKLATAAACVYVSQKYPQLSFASMVMESSLKSENLSSIIHYKDGFIPYFSKNMHSFQFKDQFQAMLFYNPNLCTDYLQKVIKSYLN
jgi:hypothetical protein